MQESYSLKGVYRQDGRKGIILGEVIVFPQTGRIEGKIIDPSSPEQNRTIEGLVKREGLQAELNFVVKVPGKKFCNVHYRVRGNPSNSSLAGTYQGSWMPTRKELYFKITGGFETHMGFEQAYTCRSSEIVPRTEDMHEQYAQIVLAKKSDKKTKKKK